MKAPKTKKIMDLNWNGNHMVIIQIYSTCSVSFRLYKKWYCGTWHQHLVGTFNRPQDAVFEAWEWINRIVIR